MRTTLTWLLVLTFAILFDTIICPPVNVKKPQEEEERTEDDVNFGLEYERYLKEVVGVLESDEAFRKKLQESNASEIKSGEIARHLEFVSHNIRTKLDEIKRKEIDRLRQVMRLQQQINHGPNDPELHMMNKNRVLAHVDHKNPNTFEVEDLAKLIKKASQDLEEIDKQRRSEFKRYELEKEAEKRERLRLMDEEQRNAEIEKLEEMKKKHADHPKIHHPISKDQLEEVWEESDGMEKEDFDPKTFFALHDQNGDMVLDEAEVEALFQKELDKVYDPKNPEDDLIERYEEMNRMREHVFKEVDTNGDKLISLEEFLKSTENEEFAKDEGWDTLDEQKLYSDEELEQFVKEYEEREKEQLEKQGHIPPPDPSQQPHIVQDHLGQGQRVLGQGQEIHMEQHPGNVAPVENQPAGNMPNQALHFEPRQQNLPQHLQQQQHQQQQQPQHVEPAQHFVQHQQEQPHLESAQHVQQPVQQPQQHVESQHFQQQQHFDQVVIDHQQQQQQQQQQPHIEPAGHLAQHQQEQPHIESVQHIQHPVQQPQQHVEPQHLQQQQLEQQQLLQQQQQQYQQQQQQQQQQHHQQQQQQHQQQDSYQVGSDHIQHQQHQRQPEVHQPQQQQQQQQQPHQEHIMPPV